MHDEAEETLEPFGGTLVPTDPTWKNSNHDKLSAFEMAATF